MAQKVFVDPIVYKVGVDISEADYQNAIEKIADWFTQTTSTKEPVLKAKQSFRECLEGVTQGGEKWWAMATASLAARVRSKCRFDIETMKPLAKASEKQKAKKQRERTLKAEKRKRANPIGDDPLYPDEIRKEARRKTTYGDKPTDVLTHTELARWQAIKDAYIRQFPEELGSMASQTELETLVDLHFINERQRMKLLNNVAVDPVERKSVIDQIDKIKTSLGIHPNQIAKRVKSKTDTSIGGAAKRILLLEDWRKLRQRFFIEEMLQLFQMYHSLTADGLSYQVDEIGLFGMTKCRTCVCPKCNTRNFVGISIDEVEAWLISKGVMEEVDPASPDPALEGEDLQAWADEADEDEDDEAVDDVAGPEEHGTEA